LRICSNTLVTPCFRFLFCRAQVCSSLSFVCILSPVGELLEQAGAVACTLSPVCRGPGRVNRR
jgi:hypothetical protein